MDSSSVHHQEFFTVHIATVCYTGYADSLGAGSQAANKLEELVHLVGFVIKRLDVVHINCNKILTLV